MSWIEEIEVDAADGKLADIYAKLIKQRGKVANILKVHSLNPTAMGERSADCRRSTRTDDWETAGGVE